MIAWFFNGSNDVIIVIGLKIASYTYGILLSLYILYAFNKKYNEESLVFGHAIGLVLLFFIADLLVWTWIIPVSLFIHISVVHILEFIFNSLDLKKNMKIFFSISILIGIFNLMPESQNQKSYTLVHSNYNETNCMLSGLDVLENIDFNLLKEKKVALLVNHTSVNKSGKHIIDLMLDRGINLKAIFTPEHGFKGNYAAGEIINDSVLNEIPIVSLYGKTKKPSSYNLKDIDIIVFDIQDIGSRFYTYISTMTYAMEAAAENNVSFMILDRYNPLGRLIDGPILDLGYSSFVGKHPIPIRHGMTVGEIAYMINDLGWLNNDLRVNLEIIPFNGSLNVVDSSAIWVNPSPNIPDFETALLYNGFCLLEGTNLSEGRGTLSPFKLFGAPWLNSRSLVEYFNEVDKIPGFSFSEHTFIPQSISASKKPKFVNELVNGVKISIEKNVVKELKSKDECVASEIYFWDNKKSVCYEYPNPLSAALKIILFISKTHQDDFKFTNFIDKLYGSHKLVESIGNNTIDSLIHTWQSDKKNFSNASKMFKIY
tara:strand:- start:648 stop:2270 length:1623 start_codon:yes stop_codon:yes gene_type:complete